MMTDQRNRWLTAMLLLAFWTVTYRHVAAQAPAATEEAPAATEEDSAMCQPDVIFVPTPQAVVDKMLELAEVKKGDVVYDLGCGDGRIVVTAAKKYGVKAMGFDIRPATHRGIAGKRQRESRGELVTIKQADIFTLISARRRW